MGRFNLLTEPWIKAIANSKGRVQEVSLLEIFEHAPEYIRLAGETEAQNFAMLRLLLAVLHTVFTRMDAEGQAYDYLELDDSYLPKNQVSIYDADDYYADLENTWRVIWEMGKFPDIVGEYLKKWEKHFYLFDKEFPFYQVTKKDLSNFQFKVRGKSTEFEDIINMRNFWGKNLNRTISESKNKTALFSPKYARDDNKEILTEAEIARWLVPFQGYIDLSDKVTFDTGENYDKSKGWLYDLGGLYVEGSNIFESLMLNFVIIHEENLNLDYVPQQRPCWEHRGVDLVRRRFASDMVDNLAELYTNWGRAVYIDPDTDTTKPFSMEIIKMPDLNHQTPNIEPLTIWRWNEQGPNKGTYTPRKHVANEALWQSFNVIAIKSDKFPRPGVIRWLECIEDDVNLPYITLRAISLQDNAKPTSWLIMDDISDYLQIQEHLLFDEDTEKWVIRIDEEVGLIKNLIGWQLKNFARDLNIIRNSQNLGFVDRVVQEAYFAVDQPFRRWLMNLQSTDSQEEKIREWRSDLFHILKAQADKLVLNAGKRDYLGRVIKKNDNDKGRELNIAIAYSKFMHQLKKGVCLNE